MLAKTTSEGSDIIKNNNNHNLGHVEFEGGNRYFYRRREDQTFTYCSESLEEIISSPLVSMSLLPIFDLCNLRYRFKGGLYFGLGKPTTYRTDVEIENELTDIDRA